MRCTHDTWTCIYVSGNCHRELEFHVEVSRIDASLTCARGKSEKLQMVAETVAKYHGKCRQFLKFIIETIEIT